MDLALCLTELDKENKPQSPTSEQSFFNSEFLSKTPLIPSRPTFVAASNSFGGYHDFKVLIPQIFSKPDPCASRSYYVVSSNGVQKIFVSRCRTWPIKIAFKPSVTPVDMCLRITPVFIDADRSTDVVERCKKHAVECLTTLKGRSIIEVMGCSADYIRGSSLPNCPSEQITVCVPLNVVQLLRYSKADNSLNDSCHSNNSESVLLPEVFQHVVCRLHCFNSCLGLHSRGETEFILTLESKNVDALNRLSYKILGLQRFGARCCSCPARDSKQAESILTSSSQAPNLGTTLTSSYEAKRSSRRLSLNLGTHNVRTREFKRRSCPNPLLTTSHAVSSTQDSASSSSNPCAVINGRTYYVTVTDNLELREMFLTLRNVNASHNKRWKSRSLKRTYRRIEKFYGLIESSIADCTKHCLSEGHLDGLLSPGSQSSGSSATSSKSTMDKAVDTGDD